MSFLEYVPLARIGVRLYVSTAMAKLTEAKEVLAQHRFHIALIIFTAVMVIVTDFLTGVLSAIVLYAILYRFFDKRTATTSTRPEMATGH